MYAKLEHLTKILKRVFRTVFQLKVKKVKFVSWYIQTSMRLPPFTLRENPGKKCPFFSHALHASGYILISFKLLNGQIC